jgi:hypothetical protein
MTDLDSRTAGATSAIAMTGSAAPPLEDCAVVELRDYTLHPGQRDVLIDLFEREFIETQEAVGMRVVATFRDLDRPDHFVWLRGFADMASRRRGLEAFYGGPVWQSHRSAANATMIDASDVRLLRPARPGWAPATPAFARARPGDDAETSDAVHVLTMCTVPGTIAPALMRSVERDALAALRDVAAMPSAVFVTDPADNDFPRLPVRTDGQVVAWLARLPGRAAWEQASHRLQRLPAWDRFVSTLAAQGGAAPQNRCLQATARSLLR